MSQSNYFTFLEKSASPQVKRELKQMEMSRRSSFSSVGTVLKERYGLNAQTFTKYNSSQKHYAHN